MPLPQCSGAQPGAVGSTSHGGRQSPPAQIKPGKQSLVVVQGSFSQPPVLQSRQVPATQARPFWHSSVLSQVPPGPHGQNGPHSVGFCGSQKFDGTNGPCRKGVDGCKTMSSAKIEPSCPTP